MAAVLMLRRNVELEIPETAIGGALARQLHIANNFTFAQLHLGEPHDSMPHPIYFELQISLCIGNAEAILLCASRPPQNRQ